MANKNLTAAKNAKNDEFYTQLTDIEKELMHYRDHFKDKIVFCNCDDPTYSNFWKYFHLNFERLGLRKLIATHFDSEKPTYKLEYVGGNDGDVEAGVITELMQNGDFRSPECIELLQEADIVVTNPPFSLFREYVAQLMEYGKKFVIIGNMNAITYKEFFPLLKENKVWLAYTSPKTFLQPDGSEKKFGNVVWYTNLDIRKRHEPIDLVEHFSKDKYPVYDNYAAFNVDKTLDIPVERDFRMTVTEEELKGLNEKGFAVDMIGESDDGIEIVIKNPVMGVPISFLDRYDPAQFEILGYTGGIGWNEQNDIKTTIEYKNAKQHNPDGSISSGGKVNTGAAMKYSTIPADRFYTASNAFGYLLRLYGRILIRRK